MDKTILLSTHTKKIEQTQTKQKNQNTQTKQANKNTNTKKPKLDLMKQ